MIALRGAVLLSDRGEVEHQPPTVEQFLMEGLGVGLVMRTRTMLLAPPPKAFRVPERTGWGIAQTTEPLIKVTEQHPVLRDIQGQQHLPPTISPALERGIPQVRFRLGAVNPIQKGPDRKHLGMGSGQATLDHSLDHPVVGHRELKIVVKDVQR